MFQQMAAQQTTQWQSPGQPAPPVQPPHLGPPQPRPPP
jgi:hypothetical protein